MRILTGRQGWLKLCMTSINSPGLLRVNNLSEPA
jgi:hypothetical protein